MAGVMAVAFLFSCNVEQAQQKSYTIKVKDQLGMIVEVPSKIERIAALHHVGGKIVFALGDQEKR
jgi:ABC-type Fe3+-hydroxamate transport system substrate-binding protein